MAAKEKNNSFQDTLDQIAKVHGTGAVISGNEIIDIERTSTGSLTLDIITGGGWGDGKIIEVYGPESSGKTTLAIHGMVESQKKFPNKKIGIIDAEHALDRTYCKKLGLNMDNVVICQPDNGEQGLNIAESLINSGQVSFLLIDSVAALVPISEINGEMEDSAMGSHARLMSKALRKLTGIANKTGTTIYFTNQLRSKIGVIFGSPEVTTGGNALKFYASIRVDMRKTAGEKEGEEVNSIKVVCKTVKNKLAPPFRRAEFYIRFGEGIDRIGEILSIAVATGLIRQAGSWFSYGETKLGQGAPAVKKLLKDNPELVEELEQTIKLNIQQHDELDITAD